MSGLILLLDEIDQRLLGALTELRGRSLDRVMAALTRLGDPAVAIVWAAVLSLDLLPVNRVAALTAASALVASHILVQLVKRVAARPRPRLPAGMTSLAEAPDRFSLPSGHAAALSLNLPVALTPPGSWGHPS